MIRSMTGYGEAEAEVSGGRIRATVKTVNHRFFNPHLRTPSGFEPLEAELIGWLKEYFRRGHVNVSISIEFDREEDEGAPPRADLARATHYLGELRRLKEQLDLPGEVDLGSLLRFGDLFRPPEPRRPLELLDPAQIQEVVREAASGALRMREEEGRKLAADLRARLEAIEGQLDGIERIAPRRLESERDRLREAIRELSGSVEIDEERLAREVAYLAERWDIHEEIVRFRAHLGAFRDTIEEDGEDSTGKRLGFLLQEMHREANTIASKANDVEISHASVAIREEIERLREQLENVE